MKDEREQLVRDIKILRDRLARYEEDAKTAKTAAAIRWYKITIDVAKRHIEEKENMLEADNHGETMDLPRMRIQVRCQSDK